MKLRTYCLACRKHTNNITSRKVTMTNEVVRDKSRCGECLSDKSRFLNQKPNKKSKGSGIKNEIKENQQLANEIHKPIIK